MPTMTNKHHPPDRSQGPSPSSRRGAGRWEVLLPALVAVVLCVPCLGLGYFWDDYNFLTFRGRPFWANLLPDPHAAFYRPLSQGLYFLLLKVADPSTGILGHVLNLAALAGAITLLVLLVERLCGRRAGILSGLAFASLGLVPGVVAWISLSQDIFAAALLLAALLLRHERRDVGALLCATGAILCKEPAIAVFPMLVLWDHLVGRPPARPRFQFVAYALVTVAWLVVHPGIHLLAGRGFQSGATGYVGVEHPERWGRYLLRYLLAMVNITPPEFTTSWWDERVSAGIAALVILVVGFLALDRSLPRDRPSAHLSLTRTAAIAALLGVPTLFMPTVLVRHWAPYFAFIPAIALALYVGPALSRRPTIVILPLLAVFLLMGIHYRGLSARDEPVWTERVFAESANAIRVVRENFRIILPSFPRGAQVLAAVSSTGVRGIHATLIEGQALSLWYRDPTLRTVSTLERLPNAPAEYLVRVTSDLDVIVIDPATGRVWSTIAHGVKFEAIVRGLMIQYAIGLAGLGDTDRAVEILTRLDRARPGDSNVDTRIAAMLLLWRGEEKRASDLLHDLPDLPPEVALESVGLLLTVPTRGGPLEEAACRAFGLSMESPTVIRTLLQRLLRLGYYDVSKRLAERLAVIQPGDPEAARAMAPIDQSP